MKDNSEPGGQESSGALYVVVGDHDRERYMNAAIRSALSLRRAMPELEIAIASDRSCGEPFDRHFLVAGDDGYRAKILGMQATPFDRTVFLDADTYVIADIADLFELLEWFDMALAHAPGRVSLALEDVPASFPEFNTGVIAFRRSPLVQSVLDSWVDEYDRLLPLDPASQDQPSFRRVSYITPNLRIATLPPELNQRFALAGYQNHAVRILHGWADDAAYELIGDAMSKQATRVFAGMRLFNNHGKLEVDFSERRKLKRLRSLLLRVM